MERINANAAGIDCGADCSQGFDYNTVVTLTPNPQTGSSFVGWSGDADCSDGQVTLGQVRLHQARQGRQVLRVRQVVVVVGAGFAVASRESTSAGCDPSSFWP